MAGQIGNATWVIPVDAGLVGSAKWVIPTSPGMVGSAKWVIETSPGMVGSAEWVIITSPGMVGSAEWVIFTGCFPKSELVQISSDTCVPIALLRAGDKIISWDSKKRKSQYTAVTEIHNHRVNEIICLNDVIHVSFSHPLMVMDRIDNGLIMPKWKVAFDVIIGDHIVSDNGQLIEIQSKTRYWHEKGIEVLSLSTDCGQPFIVDGCVVRADNATDDIEWVDTPITQKMLTA